MMRQPPLRILVVEDDPDSGQELVELLECHGVLARLAAGSGEARVLEASFRPDFALIDLELGNGSGAALAADWEPNGPRSVLLSGRRLSPQERALFPSQPPPFLTKPLNIMALAALIFPEASKSVQE